MPMWVRNLFGDSNFFGFQGSWVERDFTQLVTAVFQVKEFVKQTWTGNV